jgi:hypothetical protein
MFAVALPPGTSVDEELRERVRRRFADPKLGAALHQAGLPSAEDFLSTYWKDPEEARAYAEVGDIVRDDRPYVEYFRSKAQGPVRPSHVEPGWR